MKRKIKFFLLFILIILTIVVLFYYLTKPSRIIRKMEYELERAEQIYRQGIQEQARIQLLEKQHKNTDNP